MKCEVCGFAGCYCTISKVADNIVKDLMNEVVKSPFLKMGYGDGMPTMWVNRWPSNWGVEKYKDEPNQPGECLNESR